MNVIGMHHIRTLALAAAVTLAAGCGTASSSPVNESAGKTQGTRSSIHGLQKDLRLDELATKSDLVVRGVVSSEATQQFPDLSDVEPGHYVVATFDVTDVLRGDTAETIEIAHSAVIGEPGEGTLVGDTHHGLRVGTEYVLFLFRGDHVWGNRFLTQGTQGVGEIDGTTVTFGTGETMSMNELTAALTR
jgi:hypothetical protein